MRDPPRQVIDFYFLIEIPARLNFFIHLVDRAAIYWVEYQTSSLVTRKQI